MTTATLPLIMTSAGPQPTPPATINAALIAKVSAVNSGYTANLPASLIEDISSTCTGALALQDQARVDTVNSLTPLGVNAFLLNDLGDIYGVPQGQSFNTSVYVVVTGPAGFAVNPGFTVSDGLYQYVVQDGGAVSSFGQTPLLFCLASVAGSWAVSENSVNQIVTSIPATVLPKPTVNNPQAGVPGGGQQSPENYQAQVLQAGLAAAQGFASFFRTQLSKVSGVIPRLVSPVKTAAGNWELIVGGGDPYAVGYAIYRSLFDFFNVVGSTLSVVGITNDNPGVVTTNLDHGLSDGNVIEMTGVLGMTAVNGVLYTVTVVSDKTFSIGVDTTGYGVYTTGGVVTPNPRNVTVSIVDYPDVYPITFVNPPQQTVTMTVTWNTISLNAVSNAAMTQAAAPALTAYVNSIIVGQPMNLFELQATFQEATASILPTAQLTRLIFNVAVDGVGVTPTAGTGIIASDPEAYFQTSPTQISIQQG